MTWVVRVAGESMAPTHRSGDLLLTRRVGDGRLPRRGEVVVLRHAGTRMLKRVVGLPDDRVELEAGRLFVNGQSVDGRARQRGAYTAAWRVPKGSYFVAGDNPAVSSDSRTWTSRSCRSTTSTRWSSAQHIDETERRCSLLPG